MKFEYDKRKSRINFEKHSISLEEIQELWNVPAVEVQASTKGEARFMIVGKLKGKLFCCVYTMRGKIRRLISARRCAKKEEKIYYDYI